MRLRLGVVVTAVGIATAGCQTVAVQVPPEADLQGVRTVAVVAADMAGDPAPVALLLRSEASARIRRLLPQLTLVEPTASADAVLRMQVVIHSYSPPSVSLSTDRETGRVSCAAWQVASLVVDAAVTTGEVIRWQGLLESQRRVDLPCLRSGAVWIPGRSAESVDLLLVRDVVDELGRRLAGYTRHELRPLQTPPPSPPSQSGP